MGYLCRRPRSPVGSPQPYVPSPPRSWSLFGSGDEELPAMRAESLVEFVREFNRGNAAEEKTLKAGPALGRCKLAIWSRTKSIRDALRAGSTQFSSPVVLRFVIPDVLTAYMSLIARDAESALMVESVTAFGPRERVSSHILVDSSGFTVMHEQRLPHEQSDYVAFQGLSQHLAKMILSHPRVPVHTVVVGRHVVNVMIARAHDGVQNVLVSYRGLFEDRCTSCERVLSAEGHIPPVARIWVAGHGWEARHATCLM